MVIAGKRMPLSPRNANPMWMMHFLHHLKEGGTAGFVMAAEAVEGGATALTGAIDHQDRASAESAAGVA